MSKNRDETYSDREARNRTEAALRAAFSASHKPQAEMKLGTRKPTRKKLAKARDAAKKPVR